jgi:hypothetical protein
LKKFGERLRCLTFKSSYFQVSPDLSGESTRF